MIMMLAAFELGMDLLAATAATDGPTRDRSNPYSLDVIGAGRVTSWLENSCPELYIALAPATLGWLCNRAETESPPWAGRSRTYWRAVNLLRESRN